MNRIATEGALGVVAGLIAFFWPGLTALVLLYVIAAWAVFSSAEVIVALLLVLLFLLQNRAG